MSSAKPPVLRVEHLTMRFGGLVAIDDLSFSAARGDITGEVEQRLQRVAQLFGVEPEPAAAAGKKPRLARAS